MFGGILDTTKYILEGIYINVMIYVHRSIRSYFVGYSYEEGSQNLNEHRSSSHKVNSLSMNPSSLRKVTVFLTFLQCSRLLRDKISSGIDGYSKLQSQEDSVIAKQIRSCKLLLTTLCPCTSVVVRPASPSSTIPSSLRTCREKTREECSGPGGSGNGQSGDNADLSLALLQSASLDLLSLLCNYNSSVWLFQQGRCSYRL